MANPILSRAELHVGTTPMTVEGVVKKTSFLLGISALTGISLFIFILMTGLYSAVRPLFAISFVAILGLGFYMAMNPLKVKKLAIPYAILEGVFIGLASWVAFAVSPSIPFIALSATFVTAAVMLGFYRTGIIKVTDKLRSVVLSATAAIGIVYVVQFVLNMIFGSSLPLFNGGMLAIGFSLFAIIVASFLLLVDFDSVERGVAARVSEDYEWVYSVAILATLVWMYLEFLRLLRNLQD